MDFAATLATNHTLPIYSVKGHAVASGQLMAVKNTYIGDMFARYIRPLENGRHLILWEDDELDTTPDAVHEKAFLALFTGEDETDMVKL